MSAKVLLTKAATRARVLAGIRAAARRLKKGDLFLLTYSGHGGQMPDVTGEEADSRDETWCLFDGELIDDELYFELSRQRAVAAGRQSAAGTNRGKVPCYVDPHLGMPGQPDVDGWRSERRIHRSPAPRLG